jgi:hypothetical protein
MQQDEEQRAEEIERVSDGLHEETRSMAHLGTLFLEGTATGGGLMAGGLGVKAGTEKIKDAFTSKNEAPKIELPPGAKQE